MTTEIVPLLTALEDQSELHEARLLLLLDAFAGPKGTESIAGLTKLAKLDFLLRYPTYLERALAALGRDGGRADVQAYERVSVEATTVRYRYGPWDFRYRRWVDLLVCRGLAHAELQGRTVRVGITDTGRQLAEELAADDLFAELLRRARLLRTPFKTMGATRLKDFVYETFPEIAQMSLGETIRP